MTTPTTPTPKPIVNFTKKAYGNVCDYINANSGDPDFSERCLALLTEALRNTVGFDPSFRDVGVYSKRAEKAQAEGTTVYEKYSKPRHERLKTEYPNVPARVLSRSRIAVVEQLSKTLSKKS